MCVCVCVTAVETHEKILLIDMPSVPHPVVFKVQSQHIRRSFQTADKLYKTQSEMLTAGTRSDRTSLLYLKEIKKILHTAINTKNGRLFMIYRYSEIFSKI